MKSKSKELQRMFKASEGIIDQVYEEVLKDIKNKGSYLYTICDLRITDEQIGRLGRKHQTLSKIRLETTDRLSSLWGGYASDELGVLGVWHLAEDGVFILAHEIGHITGPQLIRNKDDMPDEQAFFMLDMYVNEQLASIFAFVLMRKLKVKIEDFLNVSIYKSKRNLPEQTKELSLEDRLIGRALSFLQKLYHHDEHEYHLIIKSSLYNMALMQAEELRPDKAIELIHREHRSK